MGQRTEQTFFQRGNADGQQAHEKMLNIANHQGTATKPQWDITHTCQNGYHQKRKTQITNVGKDMEKGNPPTLLMGM